MRALTFLARRFVAGDTAEEAIEAVGRLNRDGLKATLDYLGEDCRVREQADAAAGEIAGLFGKIARAGVDCNVSLKLTQLGLNLDASLARDHLIRLLEEAARHGNFVRIDMEGSAYTQKTLDLFYDLFPRHKNVGVVIQAYLKRSASDIEALCEKKARVRLCKGAYKEPASVAFQEREQVNRNYDLLAQTLLERGEYPAIATHDEERIKAAMAAARRLGRSPGQFEFQMLYGLRRARATQLAQEGHAVRIYVPYGTHWMPYFYRRLRERRENWTFLLRNLVKS